MRGQMLWFNEVKDYGFIMTDEGERLAVAGKGFAEGEKPEGRCAHKVVTFEVDESDGERQAQNVVFERDVAARRARMRSGGRGIRH
jgi:cold shock CspA family protein